MAVWVWAVRIPLHVSLLRVQKLLRAPCEAGISVPSLSRWRSYKFFSAALTLQAERSLILVLMWQNLQRLSFAQN